MKFITIADGASVTLAREAATSDQRMEYVPVARFTENATSAFVSLFLTQLEAGEKYRALEVSVHSLLYADPCEDNDLCAEHGVCSECLGRLEDAYNALEPERSPG